MDRRRLRSLAAALGIAALGLACQVPSPYPPESLLPTWRQFEALPPQRALAVAGNPHRSGFWVAGMAGGASSQTEANQIALEGCRQKRLARRMRAPCLLYAVGDEIVWTR